MPLDDVIYQEWIAHAGGTSKIPTEEELSEILLSHGLIGPVVLPAAINAERDRRVAIGFEFAGHLFQSRVEDQKRINGAVTMALIALSNGVQSGDLRWHGGDGDFGWLAADNSLVPMDALTVVAFGQAAGSWEAAHVFAARELKNATPIPRDFATNNSYWP